MNEQTPITTVVEVDDERLGLPSASKFSMIAECPGQPQLQRALAIKEGESSDAADRGTRIHRARETNSVAMLADEGEIDAYRDGCKLEKEAWEKWREDYGIDMAEEMPHEARVWLNDSITLAPLLSAQFDVHYKGERRMTQSTAVLITDWKTGFQRWLKPARENWQLRVQALLARNEYGADYVRVALVLMESFPPRVDYYDFTRAELEGIEAEIKRVLERTRTLNASRHAGDWCQYCPCKPFCPEAVSMALLPSVAARFDVAKPSKEQISEAVARLDWPDLAYIWKRKTIIENTLDAVTAELKKLDDAGLAVFGIKRTAGMKRRSIPSEKTKAAIEKIVTELKITEEEAWTLMSIGVKDVQDRYKQLNGLSDDKAKESINRILEDFIVAPEGDKILRPIK